MTFGRYVLTADVTVPAGTATWPAEGPPVTTTASTTATPAGGTTITSQSLQPGMFLLSWTVQLQTAAAAGDADNFVLQSPSGTTLATSVNTGTVASYPQAGYELYLGAAASVYVKTGGSAGSAGSVYTASLTVTPLTPGDRRGAVAWAGAGSPAAWAGPFSQVFLAGTPLYLDTAGALYAAIGSGNLRAWIDGTDTAGGHGHWGALSN